ncbi:MAG: hypothetical protein LC775_18335 [Acidobacteria bacterium]|nr:hypothetical protein [Acidobacteriota bacterium]
MEFNASQLRWDNERKQEVINHASVQGASARTAEQWQWVITANRASRMLGRPTHASRSNIAYSTISNKTMAMCRWLRTSAHFDISSVGGGRCYLRLDVAVGDRRR